MPENKPEIMIAKSDATVTVEGVEVIVRSGETTAFASDRIVRDNPDLWDEFEAHYEDDDTDEDESEDGDDESAGTTVSTGDVTSLTTGPVAHTEPSPRDVRDWARTQEIDVPARGPIPADVIERYKAAQEAGDGG